MKNLIIKVIKIYQNNSFIIKSSKCPFTPSCSYYAIDSIKQYGLIKGLILSVWRILRCNPFNKGYYDPPEYWAGKLKFKKIK